MRRIRLAVVRAAIGDAWTAGTPANPPRDREKEDGGHHGDHAFQLDHRSGALERRILDRLHGLLDLPDGLSRARGNAPFRCGPARGFIGHRVDPVASVDVTNDRLMSRLMDPDLLGAKDHPTITFKSTRVEAVDPAHWKVTGDLTIHGLRGR